MKFEQYLIEKESDELKTKLKDSDDYLKAPNGKPSNLPEKQWLMVRTKSFKNWFGDWETDKKNASKIIDENGEPMIMYHGTDKHGFNTFKPNAAINDLMFFSEYKSGAEIFGRTKGGGVYEVFLNIRKPYSRGRTFKSTDEIETKNKAASKGADGFAVADYSSHSGFAEKNWAIWNPNQIKSINNKGEFSKSSNNINESTESTSGFADSLKSKYGIQLSLIGRGDKVELVKIVVPKESRNDGVGTKAMKDIINWADDHKKIITLTPSSDFGGNKSKLIQFYKRFGFVENKGSFKDYEISDTMYRLDSNNRK